MDMFFVMCARRTLLKLRNRCKGKNVVISAGDAKKILASLLHSFFSWSRTLVYLVTHLLVYLSNYPRYFVEVSFFFSLVTYSSLTLIDGNCVTSQKKSRRNRLRNYL